MIDMHQSPFSSLIAGFLCLFAKRLAFKARIFAAQPPISLASLSSEPGSKLFSSPKAKVCFCRFLAT